MHKTSIHILITGGSGFLGTALLQELLDDHCPIPFESIKIIDLKEPAIQDSRISFVKGDIRDLPSLEAAAKNIDLVFHCAALVDWGAKSSQEVYEINFVGTENVLKACLSNDVKYLVYTSSLDTVFDGHHLVDIDESQPYPESFPNMYCKSKFLAEKLVLAANSAELKTCVLRPADIYGEGDVYHIGSLIEMARGGFYIRLGNKKIECQHVYSGNISHAHVLAGSALLNGNSTLCGQAYFITDGPAENFFTFFDRILLESGYKIWPKDLWLPKWLGYLLGLLNEFLAAVIRPIKRYPIKLTRFAVLYTCSNFTFNSGKAEADFGFRPKYPVQEAVSRTVKYYREMARQGK